MTSTASRVEADLALGSFPLACGQVIPEARLRYAAVGRLNVERSNLILVPTSYGARPADLAWMVGPIFDPDRWLVVIAGMFGNGASSSPSHGAMGLAEQGWVVQHHDNVIAQQRLLAEVFGVERPALIHGWSMGAQQAYQWAVQSPERVERICCVCGTTRTSPHNRLFLISLRQALTADRHWNGAGFDAPPEQGLRTYALIYASWAASQPFFRSLDVPVEQHVEEQWLPHYRRHDPRDLIAMLDTWLAHDVAAGGDLDATLAGIQARTAVVAADHDLYFTPEDMAADAERIPGADFHLIRSLLGHRAGNPHSSAPEQRELRRIVDGLLAS
ncbi:homoserine O-acetyltransferase, putative [Cyanobium sp. PCC 7001]|uniref:alpha/beta fold hydrolase n=1 Tax=Cyanobium sp. PCC 7001 TaxID=180281 RepID=UPI0001805922|nr:alpha/beta fold hydrolase [Cyanobium sp. PCC 7001]EDY37999.1 homoserine O-acetyltransferase, putative [Cyanobium sp. PCC 7001]